MKRSIVVSVVALLTVQPCRAELVGHWTFNEGTGTTAYDSADGHNGTIYGAEWTTSGLSFDGTDDYVHVPDSPALDLTVFTLDVRFQIEALPDPGQVWTILSKGEDPSTDHANYYLMVMNGNTWGGPVTSKITCAFEDHSDYNHWLVFDIDESYVGRSVRLTSTLEGDNWNMYLDGSKVAAEIYRNDLDWPIPLEGRIPVTGNSPLFFGAFADPAILSSGLFPGTIDDVRIYNNALTEAEIVPLPAGVLLGALGLAYSGWRLRDSRKVT